MDNPPDVLQQKLEQCGMSKPFLNILWLRKKSKQLHKDDQKLLHGHVHRKIGKKNRLLMFPIKTNLDIQESDIKLTETVLLVFQTLTTVMVKRNYSPRQLYGFFEQLWSDVYITLIVSMNDFFQLFFFRVE